MASARSSLPSRLRQLLSTEGGIGHSIKLDTDPPPRVKAFIDKVIQCPLQDIAIPLSGFHWEYGKGNIHQWMPLFLHFDTYFKTYISSRNDLPLSDSILDDTPFPKQAVLQILRVMQIVLENCHNKSSFTGLEHFKLLLASTDPEILISTLESLCALVKINPSKLHASGKSIGCGSVNSRLLSLAQGWGSKEEGLGLYSCVAANERTQVEGLSLFPSESQNDSDKAQYLLGSTLYYELHGTSTELVGNSSLSSRTNVIHIPDIHLRKDHDLYIMKWCIDQYNVPVEHRFSLLNRSINLSSFLHCACSSK